MTESTLEEKCNQLCVGGVLCQLTKGHDGYHSNWDFELNSAVKLIPHAESEDEAFERWWQASGKFWAGNDTDSYEERIARSAWDARARLSAGGK